MALGTFHSLIDPTPAIAKPAPIVHPKQDTGLHANAYAFNPLKWLIHSGSIVTGQFILSQCIRTKILNRHRAELRRPYVVACTHISHLEPFIVSCLLKRKIDWMARIEFFRHPTAAYLLRQADSFSVNRKGVPVRSIRSAIERLQQNRLVGIFPEGGLVGGKDTVFRGGSIKGGACLIACRANVPILPVVVLGTEKLNCVDPWLPMRRGQLWINIGRPVQPTRDVPSKKVARKLMTEQLQKRFIQTYQELLQSAHLDDADVP